GDVRAGRRLPRRGSGLRLRAGTDGAFAHRKDRPRARLSRQRPRGRRQPDDRPALAAGRRARLARLRPGARGADVSPADRRRALGLGLLFRTRQDPFARRGECPEDLPVVGEVMWHQRLSHRPLATDPGLTAEWGSPSECYKNPPPPFFRNRIPRIARFWAPRYGFNFEGGEMTNRS